MRRDLHVEDVISAALESERATQYHIVPGIVAAYYPGTSTTPASVDVTPATNDVRFVTATGARFSEPFPLAHNVPVLFLQVGGYLVAAPLAAGDKVVLLGFDLDPTAHQQTGTVADPADTRRHAGSYWCALPGDITIPGALADGAAVASGLVIGAKGGQNQIRFGGGHIQLGATGGDFLALASLVAGELTKIKAALTGMTATVTAFGTPGPVTLASPYTTVGNVASSLVKAQ